ncbi:MAG: S41 family peptidase [Rikenellaceae bacterium]|nr:S41 family peptidase [Rikenellaceae bacterium]
MQSVKRRTLKIAAIAVAATLCVGFTSVAVRDARLGQNIEVLVGMFRDLSLFYVDDVSTDKLLKDAAKGMAASLDPYTELYTTEGMEELEMMTTGKYGGIGSVIRADSDYVRIAEPYRGSPADRAGLQIGDKILSVDGKDLKGASTQEVSSRLKGEPGTTLRLTVRKFRTGEVQKLTIRRERIAIPALPYYGMLGDSLGYIHHNDFTEGCSGQMRKAIEELRKQGARGLILDYRGNGGGIVQEAISIISMFVPSGTEVLVMKGKAEGTSKVFRTTEEPIARTLPLVVVVDSYTASAAEILAGAIQDLDRGVVIGQRTFGKGLVQSTRPLGYDAFLKLTTAKYYTPSGRCIQSFDYSDKGRNGGSHIPDSLINEFSTAAGRKVYDGGGITPDVVLTPEYINKFPMMLYATGILDDYADLYTLKNGVDSIDIDSFALTDVNYDDFVAMVGDRPLDYESETRSVIKALREISTEEGYAAEISTELEALERKVASNNEALLRRHRTQISDMIEECIVLRAAYSEGVARHSLHKDTTVAEAARLLSDSEAYTKILTPKAE